MRKAPRSERAPRRRATWTSGFVGADTDGVGPIHNRDEFLRPCADRSAMAALAPTPRSSRASGDLTLCQEGGHQAHESWVKDTGLDVVRALQDLEARAWNRRRKGPRAFDRDDEIQVPGHQQCADREPPHPVLPLEQGGIHFVPSDGEGSAVDAQKV